MRLLAVPPPREEVVARGDVAGDYHAVNDAVVVELVARIVVAVGAVVIPETMQTGDGLRVSEDESGDEGT